MKFKVTVESGIRNIQGKQKIKTHTFNLDMVQPHQKTALLQMPISASGKDYVRVKIELPEDES